MFQPKDIDWLNGYKNKTWGLPGGTVVKSLPANAGDTGLALVWEDLTCCGATKPVCHN